MPTRTFDIPARGHSLAATLREITDEGGVAVRVELKPQSPFAGDPEFDSSDLSAWTQTNSGNADAINANTGHKSHLAINLSATSVIWTLGTRTAPFVHQTLSGTYSVYAAVKVGKFGNTHGVGLLAQSTSTATDWVRLMLWVRADIGVQIAMDVADDDLSVYSNATDIPANQYASGGLVFLRLDRTVSGTSNVTFDGYVSTDGKTWTSAGTYTFGGFSSDAKLGVVAMNVNVANTCQAAADYLRTWPPYVTTSPVGSVVIDSGAAGTVWDMSTFDALINPYMEDAGYRATVGAGTLKYKYGASDTNPPSLNGSYLTEAQMQAESDPTGRYFKLEVQYISANGYELASFCGAKIDGTFASGRRLVNGGLAA